MNTPIVVVVGSKPELTIQHPADGALFRAGDTINFSAIANDPDGVLSENNYKWTALFVHNEHTHPELDLVSGSSGSIKVPNSGRSFYDDTGLEITAEVTDSDGLSTIKSIRVYPEKVNVNFNSQPSGISFFSDEEILTTPIVYDNVINFRSVITAPQSTCLNGTQYDFVSWSNGKVASHIYIFPDHGETITATYTMIGSCNSSSNNSPFAFSDEVSVARGTGQIITVLSNDIDSDGSLAKGSVIITGQPQYGSITTDSDTGNITYIHNGSSAINDSFTYTVEDNDGAVSNQATVLLNIVENSCGNSLAFDGSNDWVNIPNLNLANDFTIEAWVKFAQGVDNKDVLVGQEGSGQDINFFSGKMRLFDGSDKVTATTGITAGEWTHVAITRSGSTLTAYLNGVVDGSGSWSGAFIPKAIGRGNRSFLGMFEGEMDEIRIWDVARNGSEISQNYNKKDVFGVGLVAYWDFDEGGQVVQDSGGLGNDGSLGESGNSSDDDPLRIVSSAPIEGACGEILTLAPRPIVSASSIVIDEFYNGNRLGPWVVQQPANTNFSYSVTAEKITLEGGVDNHHLTRVNTEIDPSRAYTMYSKFKVSTSGAVQSYAMSFLQKNTPSSDPINAWTLNVDFGSKQIKYMGFLNGSFRSIGSHAVPWVQTNKEYIYQIDVNRRKDGSFSPKWVTGKISDIYGMVLDHFEVDYSSFPWQPDLNESVRIGLNSHGADWEAKDLMVWYSDNSVGNHAPLANAGGDQIVSDSDKNGSEIVVLDGRLSSDLDRDSLTYEWIENSISLGSGQSINYSFDVGEHNVTLTVNDGYGEEANDNVLIHVIESEVDNTSPETQADTATVQSGESVTINVLANDSDSDGSLDKSSLTLVEPANHGTVSIDTETGEITYIHDGTTSTSDNFTYTIADDQGAVSNSSTVTITVTAAEVSASCGMGVKLDGVNDWINIPDLTLANDFTVESWVKLAPGIDNKDALFGQEGFGSDINFYASKVRIFAGGDKITANTAILPDTWTHVAITRSGTQLELYINGVLDATGNWNGVLSLKAIGRGNRGYLKGELDEVRVWNIARTDIEISASYNTDIEPTISGLIGYWKLNGADQTVTDASNSENDGTLGKVIVAGIDDPERQETSTPMTENCGSVIVDNANEAPIANNDEVGPVQAEETISFSVTDNDIDSDGNIDVSSVSILSTPNYGVATVNAAGTITYLNTVLETETVTDTLTYTVRDTEGALSNEATVSIRVITAETNNEAPITQADTATLQSGETVTIHVLTNDSDSDGSLDKNSLTLVESASHGIVSIDTDTGEITYIHNGTTSTSDSFAYTIADDQGAVSNSSTVTITVTAAEISASCGMGIKLDGINDWINIPDLTLANDFTVESWVKLAPGIDNKDALFGQEGFGSDINFYASKVRIFAGGDKITANTAILPDTWTHVAITRSGTQLELYINGVLDATGNWNGVLSLKAIGRGNRGYLKGELDEVRVWNIARTDIEISASYNTDIEPTISGLIGYWKLNGADQTVTDASNSANDGTLGKVIVAGIDDPERQETSTPMTENCGSVIVDNTNEAPIANNDTVGPVQAGETLNFTVTDNDTDSNLNISSVEIVTMPNTGTVTINAFGEITYINTGTNATTDTLSYKVADTEGAYSNVATVTINVTEPEPVNQAPIANNDEVGTVQAEGTISFSVIDNDVDSDGNIDVSSVSILATPNYGVATVNAAGTITYLNTVLETETITDTLTYTVRDTEGALSNEATVSIRVITPETNNEAPITQADTGTVQSGESVTINVLANDSDSDGSLDKNSLTLVDPANHGTVSIDTDTGEITYIHDRTTSTSDSFTYTIADDQGAVSNPSTVTITVTAAEVNASCGMGLKLDGVNDWINIPDLTLANDFTLESWVKLAPGIDFKDGLFGQEGSGPDVHFTAGKIRLYAYGIRATAKTPILADTWAHIAFTRSGRNLTVYINGEKDATGSWKGTLSLKAIGRGNRGYFGGEIDEVRIWSIARTTEEIQASYNTDIDPTIPGLIGYWGLNGAGQTVTDASGLENDGSLGKVEPVGTDDPIRVVNTTPLTENCGGE